MISELRLITEIVQIRNNKNKDQLSLIYETAVHGEMRYKTEVSYPTNK